MSDDYYDYVEEQYAMVGENTQKKYRLGDEVEVILLRASVEERNIDFVLKGNGTYDFATLQQLIRGRGRSGGSKPAGSSSGDSGRSKHDRHGRSGANGRKKNAEDDDIIAASLIDDEEQPKKHRSGHGKSRGRGPSGEKLSRPDHQQHHRKRRDDRKNDERKAGDFGRNRNERRVGREDYHRVRVTGLNSAVWPDPPGYHERKAREEAASAKTRKTPRPHIHMNRKTEGGTGNSK